MPSRLFLSLLLISTVVPLPELCSQPLLTGLCKAYIPSFGYDAQKNGCVQFIYGGCGGNDNRFATKKECEQKCRPDPNQ